jgi:hypothetical protein
MQSEGLGKLSCGMTMVVLWVAALREVLDFIEVVKGYDPNWRK